MEEFVIADCEAFMKIIDAHIHYNPGDEYFDRIAAAAGCKNTEHGLRKEFGQHHIVHGIVMGNRDLSFSNHQYPDFLSYCIGLDSFYLKEHVLSDALPLVEAHLQQEQCAGIKLYPGYNRFYVNDPLCHPFYELAEHYGKPVAIHTGATAGSNALLKYSHPLTIDEVATVFPRVNFVMCHLGNPWITDAVAVLDKNPNVAADLSGILEGRKEMDAFLQRQKGFLSYIRTWLSYLDDYSRLMYGTDWPLANEADYIRFASALIPEEQLENFFFHNALRIYKRINLL